jgi:Fur family ferric uptake transcriptional regulator
MNTDLNVQDLLTENGLRATPHRCRVLETITRSPRPVSAREILDALDPESGINRVTVYRILDVLVEKQVVERISSADRSFRYGLSSHIHQRPHAHFYCMNCGNMQCLEEVNLDQLPFKRSIPGNVSRVELRLDGTCRDCLAGKKTKLPPSK